MMALKFWRGGVAATTAQIITLTPGATIEADDKFLVTLTAEDGTTQVISTAAGGTTVAAVTAAVTAALNASILSLFAAVTWSDQTTHIRGTADVAGAPIYCATTTTESDDSPSGSQTFVTATTTASSSPSDLTLPANWSDGVVPGASDTITADGRALAPMLYGLVQSANTWTAFKHYTSMLFDVGTPTMPLKIACTTIDLNLPAVDGSRSSPGNVYLNTHTAQTALTNHGGKPGGTSGLPPVCIKGAHASNTLSILGGNVGVAVQLPGDTAQFPTTVIRGSTTKANIGTGLTAITSVVIEDAAVTIQCAATTISQTRGKVTKEGAGAVTTYGCDGELVDNSTGTVTTMNVESGGKLDTQQTSKARTYSNCNLYGKGSTIKTSLATTFTNGIDCLQGATSKQIEYPDGTTITAAAA